jgi:hypothetical protein
MLGIILLLEVHPKSSFYNKNKFTFSALWHEKGIYFYITSMCYSNVQGLLAIKPDQKNLF